MNEIVDIENVFDSYIEVMLSREIEIERLVFDENKPLSERMDDHITALLSEGLAKEIDREICQELFKNLHDSISTTIALSVGVPAKYLTVNFEVKNT